MKNIVYAVLAVFVLLSGGCANQKGAPSFALLQPEQSMMVVHPDKMEETGGTIVIFTGVLPIRFLVETENGRIRGVWPLIGVSLIDKDAPRINNGFCYSVEQYAFDKNPWGIPAPMQCVILSDKKTLVDGQYAFALANKDGGVWIASPIGEVQGYEYTIVDDKTYDWQKFENDPEYAIAIMQEIGKPLSVINEVWRKRNEVLKKGLKNSDKVTIKDDVQEIPIVEGNPAWKEFRERLFSEMNGGLSGTQRGITLPNGEVVASYLSKDEMKELLRHNPNITPWQKFLSRLRLPLAVLDPNMMLAGLATSAIDGGISAFFDTTWNNACVARGTCQRRDSSEKLVFLYQKYQEERIKNMTGGQ